MFLGPWKGWTFGMVSEPGEGTGFPDFALGLGIEC
jgi:hypothetical protein